MTEDEPLVSVRNLTTRFRTDEVELTAVDGIDFDVYSGETVCIVGESGSGKTVASESVTRIVDSPPGEIEGKISYRGLAIDEMSDEELRKIRGNKIAHVFQNPQNALNHCYTVGWQITEAIKLHEKVSDAEARRRGIELLDKVGIPEATARYDDYPHQFSGGMKQRVMIAMALGTDPELLIADEPTTALDVTIQAQILGLLNDLQEELDMSILLITHDLGVVAEVADRVIVMYAGKVMEKGDVYDIFENTSHPYTRALLECIPGRSEKSGGIEGTLPDPTDPPNGCRFASRCQYATEDCQFGAQPEMIPVGKGHTVSCIYYRDGYDESIITEQDSAEATTVTGSETDD